MLRKTFEQTVKEWLSTYGGQLILHDYNKLNDEIAVVYNNNTFYLVGVDYNTIMYAPKLIITFNSNNHVHIVDILMKNNDIGNGTIAMKALLKFAKENNIKYITGELSEIDNDHKERRDHYYKKFGFNVSSNSILLTLT